MELMFFEVRFLFGDARFSFVHVILAVEGVVSIRISWKVFNGVKWMNSDTEKSQKFESKIKNISFLDYF